MVIESIKSEYNRYKSLAELAVVQVKDEDFQKIISGTENSIAILMNHLSGNLKSRFTNFLTEDGEKPWRNRDEEFEESNKNRDALLKDWNESFEILLGELNKLTDADLLRKVKIRETELTVSDALTRSLSHLSYHVGQIVFIARQHVGANWKSLSIPKGKSQTYNLDPTKEKKPN
ncbi:MAG: DinB family protein [Bacteroidota bacterium]